MSSRRADDVNRPGIGQPLQGGRRDIEPPRRLAEGNHGLKLDLAVHRPGPTGFLIREMHEAPAGSTALSCRTSHRALPLNDGLLAEADHSWLARRSPWAAPFANPATHRHSLAPNETSEGGSTGNHLRTHSPKHVLSERGGPAM